MQAIPRCTFLSLVLLTFVPLTAAQSYKVTDLGTFSGGTVSQGQALASCGQVVGYARFSNYNAHGILWTPRTGLLDLGSISPASNFSVAQAINSSGVIAGYSTYDYPPNLNSHAVLWIHQHVIDLGTLPNSLNSQAMGINNSGQVVGFSVPHAFLWSQTGGMIDLGTLPGGGYSQALAINALGEVVGYSDASDGSWHGFTWTQSTGMQQLPELPGTTSVSANAINRKGQVVGGVTQIGEFGVLWDGNQITNLGVLPGQGWSTAFAINNHSQVVGWSGFRAFLWTEEGGIQDLNNLIPANSGWVLSEPTGINDQGQITGEGTINGQSHGFLLTPTNQPSSCE